MPEIRNADEAIAALRAVAAWAEDLDVKAQGFFAGRLIESTEAAQGWVRTLASRHPEELGVRPRAGAAARTCDANAVRGTGTGICGRPLDDLGQCDRAAQHID